MSHRKITIANREVGEGCPMFIIAEVGLAHEGSLGVAHAFIDALAETGVGAVKFQTHMANYESSAYEQFRVKVFPQDDTRYDYWERTAFTAQQWRELAEHAEKVGLMFLSSPFSNEAVDLLEECGVPAWKVASGEVTNLPMLRKMAATGKPILLSSGMSSWTELDEAVGWLDEMGAEYGMFQCTTSYPCPPETWGLNILGELKERYNCCTGLSDHSGEIFAGLASCAVGASMLEVHVTYSHAQFGPDVKSSLTFEQLTQQVQGIRQIETSVFNPVNKDEVAKSKAETRKLFSKSLYAASELKEGSVIREDDLLIRKPLIGVPAAGFGDLVGKTLTKTIPQGEPIHAGDFQ